MVGMDRPWSDVTVNFGIFGNRKSYNLSIWPYLNFDITISLRSKYNDRHTKSSVFIFCMSLCVGYIMSHNLWHHFMLKNTCIYTIWNNKLFGPPGCDVLDRFHCKNWFCSLGLPSGRIKIKSQQSREDIKAVNMIKPPDRNSPRMEENIRLKCLFLVGNKISGLTVKYVNFWLAIEMLISDRAFSDYFFSGT